MSNNKSSFDKTNFKDLYNKIRESQERLDEAKNVLYKGNEAMKSLDQNQSTAAQQSDYKPDLPHFDAGNSGLKEAQDEYDRQMRARPVNKSGNIENNNVQDVPKQEYAPQSSETSGTYFGDDARPSQTNIQETDTRPDIQTGHGAELSSAFHPNPQETISPAVNSSMPADKTYEQMLEQGGVNESSQNLSEAIQNIQNNISGMYMSSPETTTTPVTNHNQPGYTGNIHMEMETRGTDSFRNDSRPGEDSWNSYENNSSISNSEKYPSPDTSDPYMRQPDGLHSEPAASALKESKRPSTADQMQADVRNSMSNEPDSSKVANNSQAGYTGNIDQIRYNLENDSSGYGGDQNGKPWNPFENSSLTGGNEGYPSSDTSDPYMKQPGTMRSESGASTLKESKRPSAADQMRTDGRNTLSNGSGHPEVMNYDQARYSGNIEQIENTLEGEPSENRNPAGRPWDSFENYHPTGSSERYTNTDSGNPYIRQTDSSRSGTVTSKIQASQRQSMMSQVQVEGRHRLDNEAADKVYGSTEPFTAGRPVNNDFANKFTEGDNSQFRGIYFDKVPENAIIINKKDLDAKHRMAANEVIKIVRPDTSAREITNLSYYQQNLQMEKWLQSEGFVIPSNRDDAINDQGILISRAGTGENAAAYRFSPNVVMASYASGSFQIESAFREMEEKKAKDGDRYISQRPVFLKTDTFEWSENDGLMKDKQKSVFTKYSANQMMTAYMAAATCPTFYSEKLKKQQVEQIRKADAEIIPFTAAAGKRYTAERAQAGKKRLDMTLNQGKMLTSDVSGGKGKVSDDLKIRQTQGKRRLVLNMEMATAGFAFRAATRLIQQSTAQTEFGKGMRPIAEGAMIGKDIFTIMVVNNARRVLASPLEAQLRVEFMKRSTVDFKMRPPAIGESIQRGMRDYIGSLNRDLQELGLKGLHASGTELAVQAKRQMNRVLRDVKKNGWTPKRRQAYRIYKKMNKAGEQASFSKVPKVRVSTLWKRIGRYSRQAFYRSSGEFGQGLQYMERLMRSMTRSVKLTVKTAWKAAQLAYIAARKTSLATAKLALARAKKLRSLAKKPGADAAKLMQKSKKLQKRGLKKMSRRKKVGKRMGRMQGRLTKFMDRIRDPLGLKRRMAAMRQKMWTFLKDKIKPLGFLAKKLNPLSKALAALRAALFAALKYVAIAVGIVVAFLIMTTIIYTLLNMAVSAYDFNSQREDYTTALIETLEEAWEEDFDEIESRTADCESVTITYVDVMDSEAYTEYEDEHEEFVQSTNCAEVLSMTLVYFGLDFDSADETGLLPSVNKVCKYAEQLYHGSHEIEISKSTYYTPEKTGDMVETGEYDEDGNPIMEEEVKNVAHTTATVTYTSYYFNDIFDCELANSTVVTDGTTSYGNYSGEVSSERDIYLALRSAGLSHGGACGVIGNMRTEDTALDPTCTSSSGYYGICQWANGGANMILWCTANGYDGNTLTGQVAYLVYELQNNYQALYSLLCSDTYADNYDACAQFFMHAYERCVGGSGTYDYWDIYSIYSTSNSYYGTKYQGKQSRVDYAAAAYASYESIKDTWEEEMVDSKVEAAVQLAIDMANDDTYTYVYGADGPTSYDCSHFVHYVFGASGISYPYASTSSMASVLTANGFELVSDASDSSWGSARRGDIIVWNGHTAIYCGNNTIVHAQSSSTGIVVSENRTTPHSSSHSFVGIYRYVGD